MSKDYQNMKDWKLPEDFPNDLKSMKEKKQMFKQNGNGWWVYFLCKPKFVPERFKKTRRY